MMRNATHPLMTITTVLRFYHFLWILLFTRTVKSNVLWSSISDKNIILIRNFHKFTYLWNCKFSLIYENEYWWNHNMLDTVKFNLIWFLTLILKFLFKFFSPSLLRLHRCKLKMVTTEDLKTSQWLHEGKLSLEAK